MTEDSDDLGERDNEEPGEFPPAERKIFTQGYDLSINTLYEQWQDGTLIVPEFQREYVWDNPKASRLIESLLLNIPIPVLFFAETDNAEYEIVDGHQRVQSVVRYLSNEFGLSGLRMSSEFKGKRLHQLPEREQRHLKTRAMRAIIIGAASSPTMKFEVFERLNTGGLALNAQEIRNALYRGPLNDLLAELQEEPAFRILIGSKRPRKRMVDRELVLRFLALHDSIGEYRTPLVRFLNDYMTLHLKPSDKWLASRAQSFRATAHLLGVVLGERAFRPRTAGTSTVEKNVNRALFDAQMYVFSGLDALATEGVADDLALALDRLFDQEAFQNSIRRATGDRSRLLARCRAVADVAIGLGLEIDPRISRQLGSLESAIRR